MKVTEGIDTIAGVIISEVEFEAPKKEGAGLAGRSNKTTGSTSIMRA